MPARAHVSTGSLTLARTRIFLSAFAFLPLPLHASLSHSLHHAHASASHSLHPHRSSSRRGRAAVGRVRVAIIAISSLSPGGASSPPVTLPYIQPIIHPPTTNTTTMSPLSYPHYFHSFCTYHRVSFVVVQVRVCVASFIVGCARIGLVALCDKMFFLIGEKVKRYCRRMPRFHCVLFGEAERFMLGWLKPEIDGKKSA